MISPPEYVKIASIYEHQLLTFSTSPEQSLTVFLSIHFNLVFSIRSILSRFPSASHSPVKQRAVSLSGGCQSHGPRGTQNFIICLPFMSKESGSPNFPLNKVQEVTFLVYLLHMIRDNAQ